MTTSINNQIQNNIPRERPLGQSLSRKFVIFLITYTRQIDR